MKKLSKVEQKYNCDYDLIIRLYIMDKLYLSKSELNKFLKLRGEKKYPYYKVKGDEQIIAWQ